MIAAVIRWSQNQEQNYSGSTAEFSLLKCNFNKRFDLCNIQTVMTKSNENEEIFYMNDWRTLAEYSHSILSLYINTSFSLISIIFNILVIIIVSDGKISKDSNKMYLFRETPHFIQGIDKTLDPNELYLMDIPYFAERMIEELSDNTSEGETTKVEGKDLTNNKIFDLNIAQT